MVKFNKSEPLNLFSEKFPYFKELNDECLTGCFFSSLLAVSMASFYCNILVLCNSRNNGNTAGDVFG